MRKFKPAYIVSGLFLCVIIGLMFSAVYAAAKKINDKMNPDEKKSEIKIDWEAMYPFESAKREPVRRVTLIEKAYNLSLIHI